MDTSSTLTDFRKSEIYRTSLGQGESPLVELLRRDIADIVTRSQRTKAERKAASRISTVKYFGAGSTHAEETEPDAPADATEDPR